MDFQEAVEFVRVYVDPEDVGFAEALQEMNDAYLRYTGDVYAIRSKLGYRLRSVLPAHVDLVTISRVLQALFPMRGET